jgi:hypothetical protein
VKIRRWDKCMDYRYVAGLFDGEGSLGLYQSREKRNRINRTPGFRFYMKANLSNSYSPILIELQDMFGGDIQVMTSSSSDHPVYSWRIEGRKARIFLKKIRKYSRIKRPQIELALEYLTYLDNIGNVRWHPISERSKIITKKINYVRKFKALKERIFHENRLSCRTNYRRSRNTSVAKESG